MTTLIGALGTDWLRRNGLKSASDADLRAWRDFLEAELAANLDVSSDLTIGERTHFAFLGGSETHTVIEIEAFARKALDRYLSRRE